jgi:hypothetical protein
MTAADTAVKALWSQTSSALRRDLLAEEITLAVPHGDTVHWTERQRTIWEVVRKATQDLRQEKWDGEELELLYRASWDEPCQSL